MSDTPRTIIDRAQAHLIQMAPHQKVRKGGQLIAELYSSLSELERENNQLRAELKVCAECLQTAVNIIKAEYGSNNWRLVDFKLALALPSVQAALKEAKA